MDESEKKTKGLHTSIETLPPTIQKLALKEAELTKKIEEQRQKIASEDVALDALKESYAQAQRAVGAYSDEDMAAHFLKEDAAIRKEDEALSSFIAKLKLAQQQRSEAIAKMNQKVAATDQKDQYRTASIGIDAMANSLRGLSPVLGDSISGIGNLAERLVYMKQTMNQAKNAGAATGAVMGSAILGGATLAISGISMVVQAIQKADEERKQKYEQAMADLEEYQERSREAALAMMGLDEASSTQRYLESRQKLIDMFPDMVLGYSEEGSAILKNNEALQEQVDIAKERLRLLRLITVENSNSEEEYFQSKNIKGAIKVAPGESYYGVKFFMPSSGTTTINEDDPNILSKKLEAEQKYLAFAESKIQTLINGYDDLNSTQKTVADSMISDAAKVAAACETEEEANEKIRVKVKEIKDILADEKTYTDRYKVIVENQAGGPLSDEQVSAIDSIGQDIMDKLKKERTEAYTEEIKKLEQRFQDAYDRSKAAIDSEYKAVESSIKARQQAYQSMSFDVKSLDKQDLANKLEKFRLQLAAEKDMQAKSILAVQERYYKEAQLIVQTANKEIQAYKDKLAALDAADKAAEEARKKRQNEAAIRDINEDMAKQQAENAREMAEALEKYETERDRLQAIIDKPPTQTARILAERQLTELTDDWNKERENMEASHAEKLLTIQRRLDEEKLTQQEDAEAAERQSQRENLNQKMSDAENAATQQLNQLNNQYTVGANVHKQALSEQLEREKASYQQRLTELKKNNDEKLEAEKKDAQERYDNSVSDEQLIADARKEIMSKSQDEMLEMLDRYAEEARKKGKNFGAEYNKGLEEALKEALKEAKSAFVQTPGEGKEGPVHFDWKAYWAAEDERLKSIRGYATGGLATTKQLAWIAENEPEYIVPQSKLAEFISSMAEGEQAFAQQTHAAFQTFNPSPVSSQTYNNSSRNYDQSRTVHIENVNISRTVDFDLASAQIGALIGGRR